MPQPAPETTPSPELTAAIEDYLKTIYTLERDGESVSTTALAERLAVRPASVSGMLKRLAGLGLVEHERYRGVRLTDRGRLVALEVIRHHRLLELFLVESLGMSWDQVHAEADILEHHLSEHLEELIAAKLGDPTVDPHGDPIPSRELEIAQGADRDLYSLEVGERGTFVRVSDSDPAMLRYLTDQGIAPGAALEVTGRQPFDGPISIRIDDRTHLLGATLARTMRVEPS
jgi:DtxR family transcriptional regulator, Mn-dependent transcriptional regulator